MPPTEKPENSARSGTRSLHGISGGNRRGLRNADAGHRREILQHGKRQSQIVVERPQQLPVQRYAAEMNVSAERKTPLRHAPRLPDQRMVRNAARSRSERPQQMSNQFPRFRARLGPKLCHRIYASAADRYGIAPGLPGTLQKPGGRHNFGFGHLHQQKFRIMPRTGDTSFACSSSKAV